MDLDVTAQLSDLDGVLPSLSDFALGSTFPTIHVDAFSTSVFSVPLPFADAAISSESFSADSFLSDYPDEPSSAPPSAPPTSASGTPPRVSSSASFNTGPGEAPGDPAQPALPVRAAQNAPLPVAAGRGMKKRPPGNVSHTRRCRAKVNLKLQQLLEVLPSTERAAAGPFALPSGRPSAGQPPSRGSQKVAGGVGGSLEVKHKAQILGLAIERFHSIRGRNIVLEMRLAMSSPHHMRRWVRSVVESTPSLTRALKPFMALICLTRSWKYAELWQPTVRHAGGTLLSYVAGAVPPNVSADERDRLRKYRARSRNFKFLPRSGVPGRVFLTRRPEWLPLLDDEVAFPRAPYAVQHKLEVTFAVPVIVADEVKMVVEFYDTAKRNYDPQIINIANEIAAMFGSAFDAQKPVVCPVLTARL